MQMGNASPIAAWLYSNWGVVPVAWAAVIIVFALFHLIVKKDAGQKLSSFPKLVETLLYLLFLAIPLIGVFLISMHGIKTGSIFLGFASFLLAIPAIMVGAFVKKGLDTLLRKLFRQPDRELSSNGSRGSLTGKSHE